MRYYDREQDANQRLSGMYGLYNNTLCRVNEVYADGGKILAKVRMNKSYYDVDVNDPKFNFNDFHFGNVLLNETTSEGAYIYRVPVRSTRQGLAPNLISMDQLSSAFYTRESIFSSKYLTKMLIGDFTFNLDAAIYSSELDAEESQRTAKVYPISKSFSLTASREVIGSVNLVRRGYGVGTMVDGKLRLNKSNMKYLEELDREGLAKCI